MPIQVVCPHCRQQVTVAEQQFGQAAACPHCLQPFSVMADVKRVSQQMAAEPPPPPIIQTTSARRDNEARRKVNGPAIGLIVTGGLTTLTGLMFLPTLLFPEMMGQQLPWDPAELVFTILFMTITLLLGIVTLFGATKMLQCQNYPLAMAASIAAMTSLGD